MATLRRFVSLRTLPVLAALVTACLLPGGRAVAGTIVIDGVNDFAAGDQVPGTSFSTWWFTSDENNLYFAIDAPDVSSGSPTKFVVLYLDTDPQAAPLSGNGTATGVLYNTQQPNLSFNADFHFRWKADNTYTNMLDWNGGTLSWTDDNTAGGNFGIQGAQSGTYVEFSIPRANLGAPGSLRVVGSMINEATFNEWTYFIVPDTNVDAYDANFTTHLDLGLAEPVPALTGWMALALIAGLGFGGWRVLRRRTTATT